MDFKKIISRRIKEQIDLDIDLSVIEAFIKIPPRAHMGDFTFPCHQLSRFEKKAPNLIALELKEKLNIEGIERVDTFGSFLNFFIDKSEFIKTTIEKVLKEKDSYGSSKAGAGKTVVIECSSPTIAKPFNVDNLFAAVLGNSLYKIFKFAGYNCIRISHIGDWGSQFGKLIAAYKNGWADEANLLRDPINELRKIYVKFHVEAEVNPQYEDEAKMYFKRLEVGSEEEVQLWNKIKDLSIKEFSKIYKMLNIDYDSYTGESFYAEKADNVVKEIEDMGLLKESNGTKFVMLEDYNMPPCIIKRTNEATVYVTSCLAAAISRNKTYNFHKYIYISGADKALHLKQVLTTLKLMGHQWSNHCFHVGFGLVKFEDKEISIKKGNVAFLDYLFNESIEKAMEMIRDSKFDNKEEIAKKIGYGAILFTYLKNNREREIIFDWKKLLSFEGETGPYVQFTYARWKNILRNATDIPSIADYSKLSTWEEFELIKLLDNFPTAVSLSIEKYEPSVVTSYILEVAKSFNEFNDYYKVLNIEDVQLKNARINLIAATCQVIKNGLEILGLDTVEYI
jgi:arginyl-tRNA synthetase